MKKTPLLDMDRGVLNIDLFVYCVMLPQGESPLRRRQGGLSGRPLDPFGTVTPMLLGFYRKFSEPEVRWINTRTLYAEVTN